jgi:hypothetical protein
VVIYSEIYTEYNLKVSIKKASSYRVPDFLSLPIIIDMLKRYVKPANERIYQKAVLNYLTKYGPNKPVIKKEEVPAFKNKAEKGDIQAIWELRRYYEHPVLKITILSRPKPVSGCLRPLKPEMKRPCWRPGMTGLIQLELNSATGRPLSFWTPTVEKLISPAQGPDLPAFSLIWSSATSPRWWAI